MKKLLLFLASGSIALSSVAQMRTVDFNMQPFGKKIDKSSMVKKHVKNTANKTTAAPTRWYSYDDYIDQMLAATLGQEIDYTLLYIWSTDTTHQIDYSTGPGNITFRTTAAVFDPSSLSSFNNPDYYEGEMKVGPGDAYRVDSIFVQGFYKRNAVTTTIDTLRLSFLKGSGGPFSGDDIFSGYSLVGGHFPGATFLDMRYDSTRNISMSGTGSIGTPGPASYIQDIYLDAGTLADTFTNGVWRKAIALTTPINATPNQMVGVGISFHPGASTPGGTMMYHPVTDIADHNIWAPLIAFASNGTDPEWPHYTAADSNMGYFKRIPTNGWGELYIPAIGWSVSGGTAGSALQYPAIQWFVNCSTCGNVPAPPPPGAVSDVNSLDVVTAYPNPAGNELNIPFVLNNVSDVKITISNMLGQVVASQNIANVASGKAVFNTSSLPAGLYTYNLTANGHRNSGRVVVSH